jgi:hypothetical protein
MMGTDLPSWPEPPFNEVDVQFSASSLVEGLPKSASSWDIDIFRDTDLVGWQTFTSNQIEAIRAMLHPEPALVPVRLQSPEEMASDPDEDWNPNEGDSSDDCAGACAAQTTKHTIPRRPPLTEFKTSQVSDETLGLFTALKETAEWKAADTYRQQVYVAIVDLCHKHHCSQAEIARLFDKNRGTILKTFEKCLVETHLNGRPKVLDDSQKKRLFHFIRERFEEKRPPTYDDLQDFCADKLQVNILPNTLRRICQESPHCRPITGVPMEKERVACDPAEVDKFYEALSRVLANTPSCLVFNCDEAGFQEWADRKEVTVIVPSYYSGEKIELPTDRSTKRCSLLGCICADGSTVKPLLIVSRKTSELELYEIGYTPEKVNLRYQESGFMNTILFEEWLWDEIIPVVRERRAKLDYSGPSFLIMDGMSAHDSDWVFLGAEDAGIVTIFLPPHSSDQTQPLDLGIFGIQKQAMSRIHPPEWLSQQTQVLMKILGAWQAVTTPPNVVSAFSQMGISNHWQAEHNCNCVSVQRCFARKLRSPRTEEELKEMKKRVVLNVGGQGDSLT